MTRPYSGLDEFLDSQERIESFEASGLAIDVSASMKASLDPISITGVSDSKMGFPSQC